MSDSQGPNESPQNGDQPAKKIRYKDFHKRTDRTFVRGIQGEYGLKDELKRLRSLPRVIKGRSAPFHNGPQQYSRQFLDPSDGLGQTLHIHLEEYAPGGKSQKHGHVNEAVFYIMDGEGGEIHDGVRYEWVAGDAAIVHNNCVHQHFNRNPDRPARALVMKTKPMYLFMNMLFQRMVEYTPSEPSETQKNFKPRDEPIYPWSHDYSTGYHEHEEEHGLEHHHDHDHDATETVEQ
jgi:quercetin dioxygenase-like cupin family protein